jgi:hypothetical protein
VDESNWYLNCGGLKSVGSPGAARPALKPRNIRIAAAEWRLLIGPGSELNEHCFAIHEPSYAAPHQYVGKCP